MEADADARADVNTLSAVMIDQHLELELKLVSSTSVAARARIGRYQHSRNWPLQLNPRVVGAPGLPLQLCMRIRVCVLMMICLSARPVDGVAGADLTPIDWLSSRRPAAAASAPLEFV